MGFKLDKGQFDGWLAALGLDYRVFGPTRIRQGGTFADTDVVRYGAVAGFADLELGAKSSMSPKELLFPIRESLFLGAGAGQVVPAVDDKPMIVFMRPCDINGVHRLDKIFLENGPDADFYYERRRRQLRIFMIECLEGFENCYCVKMGANEASEYAVAVRFGADGALVEVKDEEFAVGLRAAGGAAADFKAEFVRQNKVDAEDEGWAVPSFEGVELDEIFEHPLWKDYTQRCIACGRCNTSCISCSCFSMQDVAYDRQSKLTERRRVWAGCHVDGFTDMAGGHAFRVKNGDRMRFKTMHKIYDFKKRFKEAHMCVGCARCDDVCPEYISFYECIRKVGEIIKELKNA